MILISNSNLLRHKTLKVLVEQYLEVKEQGKRQYNFNELNISTEEVANKLSIDVRTLKNASITLSREKEIEWVFDSNRGCECMRLLPNGLHAYAERKYVIFGRKQKLDTFYDYFKVISGIMLLVIAVTTFLINIIDTKRNNKSIQEQNLRLNKIEQKLLSDTSSN